MKRAVREPANGACKPAIHGSGWSVRAWILLLAGLLILYSARRSDNSSRRTHQTTDAISDRIIRYRASGDHPPARFVGPLLARSACEPYAALAECSGWTAKTERMLNAYLDRQRVSDTSHTRTLRRLPRPGSRFAAHAVVAPAIRRTLSIVSASSGRLSSR